MTKIDVKNWGEYQIDKLFNIRRGERQKSADKGPGHGQQLAVVSARDASGG